MKRNSYVRAIEARIKQVPDRPGLCLYYTHHVASILHEHGLSPLIQAGSLQWPRIMPDEDDGVSATHFAYMWSPRSISSLAAMCTGALPEMHVWAALANTQELIDFSTRHIKAHAATFGFSWSAPNPPSYLWATFDHIPDRVVYTPNRDATLLACRILDELYLPKYLEVTKPLVTRRDFNENDRQS